MSDNERELRRYLKHWICWSIGLLIVLPTRDRILTVPIAFILFVGISAFLSFVSWIGGHGEGSSTPVPEYPENWDQLRRQVYARDNYCCSNCGSPSSELHAHHIVPLSKQGTNNLTNLITLCVDCHKKLHPHMRD